MRHISVFLCSILGVMLFASCGMKECKCYSSNVVTNTRTVLVIDSLETGIDTSYVQVVDTLENSIDTVSNFTRGDCEPFNKDEYLEVEATRRIHHVVLCEEN